MANGERSARRHSLVAPTAAPEQTICEIRALETIAELIQSYRLRYEVYGALGYVRCFNQSKLEIDAYDSLSIPFGAFDPASGEMIGTLRLITTEAQPYYERSLRRLVSDFADEELTKQALAPWTHPLPSILSDEIDRQIEAFNTEGFVVRELSRTIVRPGHRGSGVSRGLMEFGLAHAAQLAPVVLIGGCLPEHLPMYARYGYLKLPQTGLDRFDSVGQIANTLVCRSDVLPQPTRAHVDELLRSLESGATECTLEIGRGSRALYRFAAPRRARRRTMEW
jgi:predicted GNAT family N-acyltransferase